MKTYRAFAWKELRAQKIVSILILIAIILSTMMTAVVGQSIGILNAMRGQQAAYLNGNRYATFHQLTDEQANGLAGDSRLSYIGKMINIGSSDMVNSNLSLQLREYEDNALSAYESMTQLESGRLPTNAGEIALPQDVLTMLGFKGGLGDIIAFNVHISLLRDTDIPYEYLYDFVLTGILKANYMGYVSGTVTGIVGTGTAEKVLPEKYQVYSVDIRTADKRAFQDTVDSLAGEYSIPEYYIQYNDTMLATLGIDYRAKSGTDNASGFSLMTVTGVLISALILLAAGLVIYNILKIAVAKRVKEYGTLRAIGAERSKLYTLVALQLAILCGIGIPIGAVFGVLSAKGILSAAVGLFMPDIFMASSQNEVASLIAANGGGKVFPLVISAVITLLFAFIAAMPAARWAARVSPTVSMSGMTANVKRRNRKTGRIRNFEAFYARMNMKRNTGRTAITILSLVMSITVFIALQSFSGLLDASASVQQMHLGDYSVTNNTVGFSPVSMEKLKTTPGISSVSTLKHKLYMQDENGNAGIAISFDLQASETLHIAGIDEHRIKAEMPDITDADLQALKDGTACFIKNPVQISFGDTLITSTTISTGETITVNGKDMTVIGEFGNPVLPDNEGFINGVQVIVYDTVYDEITGQGNYTELYPILSQDADREIIEQSINALCEQTGGSRWLSYQNTDRQLKESYEQIRLLAWGLILLIGLIGILNIINTVYTNTHTRITEIGVQRAIGMSAGSLYKTFLWEGAYYGIIAAVIGSLAGYVCTVFVSAAATNVVALTAVPIMSILEATILSILACLIATCIPLKKIADMSIVESIETVE